MWVFLNNAFVSLVQDRRDPNRLLARARLSGDLSRAFPGVKLHVTKTPDADYRFRTSLPKQVVANAVRKQVMAVSYANFKDSVAKNDHVRKAAYMDVWVAMNNAQVETTPARERRKHGWQNLFPKRDEREYFLYSEGR